MAHTLWSPKRQIPLVNLLLWRKTKLCAASFCLQPCDCGQAGRQADRQAGQAGRQKLSFGDFQIRYPATCNCFLVFSVVFDVKWTNICHYGFLACTDIQY